MKLSQEDLSYLKNAEYEMNISKLKLENLQKQFENDLLRLYLKHKVSPEEYKLEADGSFTKKEIKE